MQNLPQHQTLRAMAQMETSHVGHQDALRQLDRLREIEAALISVTGPPGVGKSRLVRQWLHLRGDSPRVLSCDLQHISRMEDVCLEVALSLGISLREQVSVDGMFLQLVASLKAVEPEFVVFEHIDHVHDHVFTLTTYMKRHLPTCTWITTGRQRLSDVPMDKVVALAPLSTDEAVTLFIDRARRIKPQFEADATVLQQIEQLVMHLDCLPLAIELAASRVRMMPPAALLRRLPRRFELLRPTAHTSLDASRSLEEAVRLAWESLTPPQQQILSWCAVFCGPFSLEAAEAILPQPEDESLWLVDILESLCDGYMLHIQDSDYFAGEIRLTLLESIRDFILQFHPPDAVDDLRQRHSAYYAAQGKHWLNHASLEDGGQIIHRIAQDRHHFDCILERDQPEHALDAALVLDLLCATLGATQDHEALLTRALLLARANGLEHIGYIHHAMGRWFARRGLLDQAIEHETLAVQGADLAVSHRAIVRRAELWRTMSQHERAISSLSELLDSSDSIDPDVHQQALIVLAASYADTKQLDLAREIVDGLSSGYRYVDLRLACEASIRLAYVYFYLKRPEEQRFVYQQTHQLAQRLNDQHWLVRAGQGLADVACILGDYHESIDAFESILALQQRMGLQQTLARAYGTYAAAQHRAGRLDDARQSYERAIFMHREQDSMLYLGTVLHARAALEHEAARDDTAARRYYQLSLDHFAQHDRSRDNLGATLLCRAWHHIEHHQHQDALVDLEQALGCFDQNTPWALAIQLTQHLCGTPQPGALTPVSACLRDASLSSNIGYVLDVLNALCSDATDSSERLVHHAQATHSLYGRLVCRLLSLDGVICDPSALEPSPSGPSLRLGPECKWFEFNGHARVNLARRKAIRAILFALVEQIGHDPMDVYTLFDLGWPDQEIDPELAAERVYWAIRTLRQLGLQDILQTTDDGYLLDPLVSISWAKV